MKSNLKFEYRITAAYLLIGGIWIIFSDKILHFFVTDDILLTTLQTYKGWFYVIVTGILFYLLLKKHLERLRKAEHEARESDRLKTAFLQNISHEIRTPMNSIIGFTGLLKTDNLSEDQKIEYINIITKSSNQLLTTVNDVLEISMLETGNTTVNKDVVNINKMMDELYSIFSTLISKDIHFILKKGLDDSSSVIVSDNLKLKQTLIHLLKNATKFTEKGTIELGYFLNQKNLEFFVNDTGKGINRKLQHNIFESFSKEEKDNFKLYDGVGLGLAICKGNIDLLQGSIRVESEINKGSKFSFTIPYTKIENSVEIKNKLSKTTKILVVEDDDINFLYVEEILKRLKINYERATDGEQAVEICSKNNQLDLVFMDIKLPKLNGYQALKLIHEFNPKLPVIAQTAFTIENDKEKVLNSGFCDYLSKPYLKEELIQIFRKYDLVN